MRTSPYRVTSPATDGYNCIAWAADNDAVYWPPNAPREETLDAFTAALAILGYAPCPGEEMEPGFEKIALFAVGTHAARQLPNGRWTSKLGRREDIEHDLHAIGGTAYGAVARLFKRPVTEELGS